MAFLSGAEGGRDVPKKDDQVYQPQNFDFGFTWPFLFLSGLDSVFLQAFLIQVILEALLVLVLQVLVLVEMVAMGTFLMLVLRLEATLPDQSNVTSMFRRCLI